MVIMEDPEDSSLVEAPKNRAQVWFRVVLWFAPAVFALALAATTGVSGSSRTGLTFGLWMLLNFLVISLAAWVQALLSRPAKLVSPIGRRQAFVGQSVIFVVAQLILGLTIAPLVYTGILQALVDGKFGK